MGMMRFPDYPRHNETEKLLHAVVHEHIRFRFGPGALIVEGRDEALLALSYKVGHAGDAARLLDSYITRHISNQAIGLAFDMVTKHVHEQATNAEFDRIQSQNSAIG